MSYFSGIWWLCLSAHDKPIVELNSFQHTLSFVKAISWMTYPYSTFVEFAAFLQSQVREKSSPSGIILVIYVDSEKLHANSPERVYASSNARWKTSWYCILGQYIFWEGPDSLWYWISFFAKKNVLKFLYWGSDVLKFWLKWGLAMFLRCSYFFPNLSLDVLIDLVLNQKNACNPKLSILFF